MFSVDGLDNIFLPGLAAWSWIDTECMDREQIVWRLSWLAVSPRSPSATIFLKKNVTIFWLERLSKIST
jgi:hypothetical protein